MSDPRPMSPPSPVDARTHAGAVMARSISRELGLDHERPPLRLLPDSEQVRRRFRGGLPGGALRRVRVYIDDHIGKRISLDELACQAGFSRFHFARQFRLSTGESPMGFLRRVRIEHSKRILQTGEATIAEVAARLGFADQSHFTRTFVRLVGMSPGDFVRSDEPSFQARRAEPDAIHSPGPAHHSPSHECRLDVFPGRSCAGRRVACDFSELRLQRRADAPGL